MRIGKVRERWRKAGVEADKNLGRKKRRRFGDDDMDEFDR